MPVPNVKAMLLCDQIITELGTHKKSLIGVFEHILTSSFPCHHYALSVYVKFTEAKGRYRFRLELVDLLTGQAIGRGEAPELSYDDPLGTYELAFNLGQLTFSHEGKYEFRLSANDELMAQKEFHVKKIGGR